MKKNILPMLAFLLVMGICLGCTSSGIPECNPLIDWYPINTAQPSRVKAVHLQDLLVNRSAFPEGWDIEEGPVPLDYEDDRNSEETFHLALGNKNPNTGAGQEVYRYKNDVLAKCHFYLAEWADFSSGSILSDWKIPSGWTYRSPFASEFEFACADFQDPGRRITSCVARSRYGEFVSIFGIVQPLGSVNLQDLEHILRDIDARMEKNLK